MQDPPNRPKGYSYDRAIDRATNPSIFVIFRDISAYPLYLYEFSWIFVSILIFFTISLLNTVDFTFHIEYSNIMQGCPLHGSRASRGSLRGFAMALWLFQNSLRMVRFLRTYAMELFNTRSYIWIIYLRSTIYICAVDIVFGRGQQFWKSSDFKNWRGTLIVSKKSLGPIAPTNS